GGTGGASGGSGNYDAATRLLSLGAAPINILDKIGGLSGGLASAFATDPLVGATLAVSPLTFLGLDSNGESLFSGGQGSITRSGNPFLTGTFSSFKIGDTTASAVLDSFGVFDDLLLDSNGLDSPFLDALFHTAADRPDVTADFYFVTGQNLLALTSGFSQS